MVEATAAQLDTKRLEEVARVAEIARARRPLRSRLTQWSISLGLGILMMLVVLPLLNGDFLAQLDVRTHRPWLRMGFAVIFACANVIVADRYARQHRGTPEKYAVRMQRDFESLVNPGWLRRTLVMGGKLGLGVGLPVGLLIASLPLEEFRTIWDRAQACGYFLLLTLAWTVPGAFGIRQLVLRDLRKYQVSK